MGYRAAGNEPRSFLSKWGCTLGCLIVAILPVLIIVALSAADYLERARGGDFPPQIALSNLLETNSEFGLREGCAVTIFALDSAFSKRVRTGGVRALGARTAPRTRSHPRNPFGAWQPTPVRVDRSRDYSAEIDANGQPIFATGAVGCRDEDRSGYAPMMAWSRPGSFYALTANGEGMILIDPISERATFLYFG